MLLIVFGILGLGVEIDVVVVLGLVVGANCAFKLLKSKLFAVGLGWNLRGLKELGLLYCEVPMGTTCGLSAVGLKALIKFCGAWWR